MPYRRNSRYQSLKDEPEPEQENIVYQPGYEEPPPPESALPPLPETPETAEEVDTTLLVEEEEDDEEFPSTSKAETAAASSSAGWFAFCRGDRRLTLALVVGFFLVALVVIIPVAITVGKDEGGAEAAESAFQGPIVESTYEEPTTTVTTQGDEATTVTPGEDTPAPSVPMLASAAAPTATTAFPSASANVGTNYYSGTSAPTNLPTSSTPPTESPKKNQSAKTKSPEAPAPTSPLTSASVTAPTSLAAPTKTPSKSPKTTTKAPAIILGNPKDSAPSVAPVQEPVFGGVMVAQVPLWDNSTDLPESPTGFPSLSPTRKPTIGPSNPPTKKPTRAPKDGEVFVWEDEIETVWEGESSTAPAPAIPTADPWTVTSPRPSLRQTATMMEPTMEQDKDDKDKDEDDKDDKDASVPTISPRPSKAPSKRPTFGPTVAPGNPTKKPTPRPTPPTNEVTFVAGLLTEQEVGLSLSTGLTARIIAVEGQPVPYEKHTGLGTESVDVFHGEPDGGAVFMDPSPTNQGGWIYVSNSEETDNRGGVGAITFDGEGKIIKYERLLRDTSWNCGGGKTPWGTWVSCEETEGGIIFQVDPTGQRPPQVLTMGRDGGYWESFAYDVRNRDQPRFFVTEDATDGVLQRFTPNNTNWSNQNTQWNMLHGPGVTDYLLLQPNHDGSTGTFSWGNDLDVAKGNAEWYYPNTEGVDVHNGVMYFVCKEIKMLFELHLDTMQYTYRSTESGIFDGEPDQLQSILSTGGEELLFFTEDGGDSAGVHGRDETGVFFTIFESEEYDDETTGLALSPDARHMYVAYQDNGLLFEITRKDGHPFSAKPLNVKYHSVSRAANRQRGRNFGN